MLCERLLIDRPSGYEIKSNRMNDWSSRDKAKQSYLGERRTAVGHLSLFADKQFERTGAWCSNWEQLPSDARTEKQIFCSFSVRTQNKHVVLLVAALLMRVSVKHFQRHFLSISARDLDLEFVSTVESSVMECAAWSPSSLALIVDALDESSMK